MTRNIGSGRGSRLVRALVWLVAVVTACTALGFGIGYLAGRVLL